MMRLIDLVVVYFVVGAGCAIALFRRRPGGRSVSGGDAILVLFVWPIYLPLLFAPVPNADAKTAADPRVKAIREEHTRLLQALERIEDPALRVVLPTREQLARVGEHLMALDAKISELDDVLVRDEFDSARAERELESQAQRGGTALESAQLAVDGIHRLRSLRSRAASELEDLLALSTRLRTQLTVLRFAGTGGEEVRDALNEILARVAGVGAALEPAVQSQA